MTELELKLWEELKESKSQEAFWLHNSMSTMNGLDKAVYEQYRARTKVIAEQLQELKKEKI